MSEKYGIIENGCWNMREGAGKATEVQENTQNQGREELQDIVWVWGAGEANGGAWEWVTAVWRWLAAVFGGGFGA